MCLLKDAVTLSTHVVWRTQRGLSPLHVVPDPCAVTWAPTAALTHTGACSRCFQDMHPAPWLGLPPTERPTGSSQRVTPQTRDTFTLGSDSSCCPFANGNVWVHIGHVHTRLQHSLDKKLNLEVMNIWKVSFSYKFLYFCIQIINSS